MQKQVVYICNFSCIIANSDIFDSADRVLVTASISFNQQIHNSKMYGMLLF